MNNVSPNGTNSRIGNTGKVVVYDRKYPFTEKATDFFPISPATKAIILSKLAMVDNSTFTGYSIALFVRDAHLKTDEQVMQCVLDLQSQIRDNAELMMQILGMQFQFINEVRFKRRY